MKLKIYDDYIKEENDKFKRDKINKKQDEFKINALILLLIITIGICFFTPVFSSQTIHYRCRETVQAFPRIFPNTWDCKKCGYENYEGINKCPICGTLKNF